MASWGFLKDGAGILPASNMADPLRSTTRLRETDVLVREAVQNSLDERHADAAGPVRVRFERTVLTGNDKKRFVDGLRLRELSNRRDGFSAAHNWFAAGNKVLDDMDDPAVKLPVLTISDFGANGLGGRWNRRGSKDDRFFNLVLSIGGSLKWEDEDESTGASRFLGSYGYGKMAFAMCSDIRTIVYYSTFHSDDGATRNTCRAMASSFLPQHTIKDVNYAGQAYFGMQSKETGIPRAPFVDGKAHTWIRSLGLPERSDADTGTMAHVLDMESDEDSDEPGSLVSLVADLAKRRFELPLNDLRSIYHGPHGQSRLLPWAWRLAYADRAFSGLRL